MSFKVLRCALLAAPMLVAATGAHAAKRDFETCDGLRAPGKGATGMAAAVGTSGFAMPFGLVGTETATALITACTNALADVRLLPTQALRRSHLLRARAIARLQAGDPDAAIADLDAALAAAGPLASDPLFVRSMGVSLTLVRAAAYQAKGDRPRARTLAAEAAAARPYSVSVQSLAAVIAQRARDDTGSAAPATMATLLPLIPDALAFQFNIDFEGGRFAAAAALYPRVKPQWPERVFGGLPMFGTNGDASTLVATTLRAANAAYAYAAIGQAGRAREILADARTRSEAALPPIPGRKDAPATENPLAQPLKDALARMSALVEARIAIAEGRPRDALKPLVGTPIPVNAASVELLTALRAALPADSRELAPDPADMAAKVAEQRRKETLDTAMLRKSMAAPETSANLADYEKSSGGLLYSFFVGSGAQSDGFKSKTDEKTGITHVEFVGQSSSAPAVEELTLLRAADLARQAGKPGLIIVARNDYQRTMTMTRGYSAIPISSTPAGYKTELDVRFVDPAALPADLAGERDRMLDANRIYATLAPVYIPPAAPARK